MRRAHLWGIGCILNRRGPEDTNLFQKPITAVFTRSYEVKPDI